MWGDGELFDGVGEEEAVVWVVEHPCGALVPLEGVVEWADEECSVVVFG